MGGCRRRLWLRLRRVRGQLCGDWGRRQGDPGRPAHPRLSAAPDRALARAYCAGRQGGREDGLSELASRYVLARTSRQTGAGRREPCVLMMRLYWPKENPPSLLDGTWEPPSATLSN